MHSGLGYINKYNIHHYMHIIERIVSEHVSNSQLFLVLLVFKGLRWRRGSMDAGSLGSVPNEDRLGNAGYMEQE